MLQFSIYSVADLISASLFMSHHKIKTERSGSNDVVILSFTHEKASYSLQIFNCQLFMLTKCDGKNIYSRIITSLDHVMSSIENSFNLHAKVEERILSLNVEKTVKKVDWIKPEKVFEPIDKVQSKLDEIKERFA